jgi:hypothetical protein
MERIEFCFFDAGGGHRAAATALEMSIRSQGLSWDVRLTNLQELLDELDILKKTTGIRIQDCYNNMLRTGWTLGSTQLMRVLQLTIRAYHSATLRLMERHWKETNPDMVVSFVPHFNRALYESFHRAFPGRPVVTVLTDVADYPEHFWIERNQQQHFVCGSERAVAQARERGYSEDRIFQASGMILHPRFYEKPVDNRIEERERLGLRPNLPTGLIIVCGKNEKLAAALRARKFRFPVFIEGFTSRVNYYMHLADFFIGKPGPGSLSEALAMHLPVIVERNAWTLPQERYNADWVLENEVGLVLPNFRDIDKAVALLIEPETLARYRRNATAMKNQAVFEIPVFLKKILEQRAATEQQARPAILVSE